MTDEIRLTIPRDRALYSVAHLVVGGLGIRLDLTIEHLEDLQLALDAVLERARESEEVTIAVMVKDGAIETAIGPLRDGVRERARGDGRGGSRAPPDPRHRRRPGRARLREDGDWVTLTKTVEARGE